MILSAAAPREIPAQELESWWSPRQAMDYGVTCIGSPRGSANAIWQALVAGLIETATTKYSATPNEGNPTPYYKPNLIPGYFWQHFVPLGSDVWESGHAKFSLSYLSRPTMFHCFGIKLNPDDIRTTLPAPRPVRKAFIRKAVKEERAPVRPVAAPDIELPSMGGRPRKDWWDDFWIEICGQIYEGRLKPKRQAELERAMLDWATNHGHEMSEATARKAARKLFVAWKLGG